jgi:hypothetical protein
MWGALAIAGASLVGGYLSSRSQSRAASKSASAAQQTEMAQIAAAKETAQISADAAIEAAELESRTIRDLYRQSRGDLEPFRQVGINALQQLMPGRYEPGTGYEYLHKGEWIDYQPAYLTEEASNALASGQLRQKPGKWISGGSYDPTAGAQEWMSDITGVGDYITQLEGMEFDFQLDPDDPVYQWRQAENQRTVNQFFASRGGYDSRAAANMLLRSGMELQGAEEERQYSRYAQRYQQKYNQLVDLANLRTNRGVTGFNMAMQLGGAKTNYLQNLLGVGQASAAGTAAANQTAASQLVQASQVGTQGQLNALALGYQGTVGAQSAASQALQSAYAQQGLAQAGMWSAIGQAPANYLATKAILQGL